MSDRKLAQTEIEEWLKANIPNFISFRDVIQSQGCTVEIEAEYLGDILNLSIRVDGPDEIMQKLTEAAQDLGLKPKKDDLPF